MMTSEPEERGLGEGESKHKCVSFHVFCSWYGKGLREAGEGVPPSCQMSVISLMQSLHGKMELYMVKDPNFMLMRDSCLEELPEPRILCFLNTCIIIKLLLLVDEVY